MTVFAMFANIKELHQQDHILGEPMPSAGHPLRAFIAAAQSTYIPNADGRSPWHKKKMEYLQLGRFQ